MDEPEGLIAKSEDYFGRWPTAAAVAILLFCTCATAIGLAWTSFLGPLWGIITGTGLDARTLVTLTLATLWIVMAISLADNILKKRHLNSRLKDAKEILERANAAKSEALQWYDRAIASMSQAQKQFEVSRFVVESCISILREHVPRDAPDWQAINDLVAEAEAKMDFEEPDLPPRPD